MENLTEFKYAGFWKRFVAFIIDQLIINVVSSMLIIPVLLFFGLSILPFTHLKELNEFTNTSVIFQNSSEHIAIISSFIIAMIFFAMASILFKWLYYSLMESSAKQATLGKMALGIKVVDLDGNRISFGKATGRYFGKIISTLIIYIGFMMAGWTIRKQALHDIMAGCLVINEE